MSRYLLESPDRCVTCGHAIGGPKPLTRRQTLIYDYVYDYSEQHGHAPSFNEIADAFDYGALATVHEHLTNLERKGWVKRHYNEARATECLVPLSRNGDAEEAE